MSLRRSNLSNVVLVITDQETNAQIKHLGVGLLELRADLFKHQEPACVLDQIKKRKDLKIPLLLTVRNRKTEGAAKTFADQKKWQIIKAALPLVDMVDIELGSALLKKVIKACHSRRLLSGIQKPVQVIVSSHFFKNTPKDLEGIFKKSLKAGADLVKIAAYAKSREDITAMLDFTRRHKGRVITISMGLIGTTSRWLLPAAGSPYAYTFLGRPKAPGQVDLKTLKARLKAHQPFSG